MRSTQRIDRTRELAISSESSIDLNLDLMEARLERRWRRAQSMVARWKHYENTRRVAHHR